MTEHWDGKTHRRDCFWLMTGDGAEALLGIKEVGGITIEQKARHSRAFQIMPERR